MRHRLFIARLLLVVFSSAPLPSAAQKSMLETAAAEFNRLPVGLRYEIQMLLIVAGYSDSVTNEQFSHRLFDTITSFQAQNGFSASGILDPQQLSRLRDIADPILAAWRLRRVQHPQTGTPLWIPEGLGLTERWTELGPGFERNGASILLAFLPGTDLRSGYSTIENRLRERAQTIGYNIIRSDFFVITTIGSGVKGYARFHALPSGLAGFWLTFRPTQTLQGDQLYRNV